MLEITIRYCQSRRLCKVCSVLVLLSVAMSRQSPAIEFEEVTDTVGIDYSGPTFGMAWGEANGDGRPDLWLGHHGSAGVSKLYLNSAAGRFTDEIDRVDYLPADMHGAAWSDFDNDGDQDLLVLVGASGGASSGANQFFVNSGGVFEERAEELGLANALGRARTPLWFDWNGDGSLDVFLANWARPDGRAPSALFSQNVGSFSDSFAETNLMTTSNNEFAQLISIGNKPVDSMVISGSPYPDAIYSYGVLPFEEISNTFVFPGGEISGVRDVAIGDFNGDLLSDVFILRAKPATEVIQTDANSISARLIADNDEQGFSFHAEGVLEIQVAPNWNASPSDIFIGETGIHPGGNIFLVSSNDPQVYGLAGHVPGVDFGVYISYEPATALWQVLVSKSDFVGINVLVTAESPISKLADIGSGHSDGGLTDRLYLQGAAGFSDASISRGFDVGTPCRSVVAADFDNDMDLDLYMNCGGPATNHQNILYENTGDASFVPVQNSGGAAGSDLGIGDGVTTVDYDGDGYIDLFVTNGRGDPPFNNGPAQLFRNKGTGNHWVEIDLEGVDSNRDGIGARVRLTAGGLDQVRIQGGGIHNLSQDHQRLHFGLADNTRVDRIEIEWPSGRVQTLTNIPVDQIIHISETAETINTAPTISTIGDLQVKEDLSTGELPFVVGDAETDASLLSVTASSSDQGLIPDDALLLAGTGEQRTINATPAPGRSGGSATIMVAVSDGVSNVSTEFDVTVIPVNDAPVALPDVALVGAGEKVNINVAMNDSDGGSGLDLESVAIVSEPVSGVLYIKPDGSLDYLSRVADVASDRFSYTISDESGAVSNSAPVEISIIPPVIDQVRLSTAEAVSLGLDPTSLDGDSDADGLSDVLEVGGDLGNPLDSDEDGVIDALEPGFAALDAESAEGLLLGEDVTVSINAIGQQLTQVGLFKVIEAPAGFVYPFDGIKYHVTSPVGGSVKIQLAFSEDIPAGLTVFKVDHQGWYTVLPESLWRRIDDHALEITLVDGDLLTDLDGIRNGLIDDPIVLAVAVSDTPSNTAGGGGGGCTISGRSNRDPLFEIILLLILLSRCRMWFQSKSGY